MKGSLATVLLLVQLVLADNVLNINDGLDKGLELNNRELTRLGLGLYRMQNVKLPSGQELGEGVLVGGNSAFRTGDSVLITDDANTRATLDMHMGLRLLDLAFGRISIDGEEMSGVFRVKDNSFHVAFTVNNPSKPDCRVSLDNYEIERLTNVTFDASLASHDGQDFSAFFSNVLLPELNQVLAAAKSNIQSAIQLQVCAGSHLLQHFSVIPKVVSSLLQA